DKQRRARRRLVVLYQQRVLDRFRPPWQQGKGSTQYHWVLDEVGAHLVADELGIDRADLHWRHADALAIAGSAKLAHQVAANELITRLASEARTAGGRLREWYGERTTRRLLGGQVIPDTYAVMQLPGRPLLHLLVELDRGTEDHKRLREKATGYHRALPRSPLANLNPTVLLVLPNRTRATALRDAGIADGDPLTPIVWTPASTDPALPAVLTAATTRVTEPSAASRASSFTRQDSDPELADHQGSSAGPTSTEHTYPQEHEYD
ncbi:MAG: replication-relaxation family protein, partial [Trebonia sp.]